MTLFRIGENADARSMPAPPPKGEAPRQKPPLKLNATVRLIGDIGGTNVRFALVEEGRIGPVTKLDAKRYPSFEAALDAYLDGAPRGPDNGETHADMPAAGLIGEVAIAAAGPLDDGAITLTNLPWTIEAKALSSRFSGAPVRLFNDLEAVALAMPRLGPDEADIRAGTAAPLKPMIAINAGTGFGAALAVPLGRRWTAVACEPGHMAFAAATPEESRILGAVTTAEDILSGRGLVWLHRRLGGAAETAEQVFKLAGSDRAASEAVTTFARYLGRVAGDLVLATGAWGGVWFCGALLAEPRGAAFDRAFLTSFGRKGAMSERIGRVPVRRISARHPALIGLAAAPLGRV